jgi:nucleoside triphosphate pyrophosphatase
MLILASNSPRRRRLLALLEYDYHSMAAEIDESPQKGESAEEYVLRLAVEKSSAIYSQVNEGDVILAADTTVVYQDQILGKPVDPDEAYRMLINLRGNTHQVMTGLSLMQSRTSPENLTALCVTEVTMRWYSDDEIIGYIQTGDPLDKAGAYAIQHSLFNPVKSIEGCFANVVGLPLCQASHLLSQVGFPIQNSQIKACLASQAHPCQMMSAILTMFE